MKIDSLQIVNFRGIRDVSLDSLGNVVVIAGQNGSGKSCLFDAIRLLKSVYGGYQANEWHQWMGEFQISLTNRSSDFASMFNDSKRELRIACDFRLAAEERQYIQIHADELLREKNLAYHPSGSIWLGRFSNGYVCCAISRTRTRSSSASQNRIRPTHERVSCSHRAGRIQYSARGDTADHPFPRSVDSLQYL